jgi:glucuronoarabinoxylan endo-1,4-beta-xylanase
METSVQLPRFANSRGFLRCWLWVVICATPLCARASPQYLFKFEAESGVLGSAFAVSNGAPVYITITTDSTLNNPGDATRVATYTVTLPVAGAYDLYARVRVGPGTFNDDSMFYGNGFDAKDPTLSSDWILVNGLGTGGFTSPTNVVTGGGTAGSGVWKWINLSQFAPGPAFTVTNGGLTQTFQIGARENGLDIDAFAFGVNGVTFTVAELDAGDGGTLPQGNSTINWNDTRQKIDGFGGGVVFLTPSSLDPVTDANMDKLFGTNANQLALTLLRVRIDPGTNWSAALSDAKKAAARGVGVLATPWTPPAWLKDNNSLTNGSVLPAQYANYAAYLKKFADYMSSNGAPLRAISIQNEPDWPATYESCVWNSNQFLSFFRTNAAAIGSTPVMMPESLRYDFSYSDATLNDAVAVTNVDLVGGHLYGVTTIRDYTNAHNKGKPTWMTEFLLNDQTIESAIETAQQIHDCLTTGNMSAYIWWKCLGDANGLVDASGVIRKRGYVMSQFSRFARPGYYRIGTTNSGSGFVSAYRDTNSGRFAIVAINTFSIPFNETFTLTNFNPGSVTPWITSETQSLAVQSAVTVSNATFSYTLPPNSVVTFAGQFVPNTPPAFATVTNRTINPGVTLTITNSVVDPDVPGQTLTFSLLNAPTNASLVTANATNALFTWRPLIAQADGTNAVQIKVTDNGTPNLSATHNFLIIVNPASSSAFDSVTMSGGATTLSATGLIGPDYTLLSSTNLLTWQTLFTTNPAAMPVTFTDTNQNDSVRFYRLQLGP